MTVEIHRFSEYDLWKFPAEVCYAIKSTDFSEVLMKIGKVLVEIYFRAILLFRRSTREKFQRTLEYK